MPLNTPAPMGACPCTPKPAKALITPPTTFWLQLPGESLFAVKVFCAMFCTNGELGALSVGVAAGAVGAGAAKGTPPPLRAGLAPPARRGLNAPCATCPVLCVVSGNGIINVVLLTT